VIKRGLPRRKGRRGHPGTAAQGYAAPRYKEKILWGKRKRGERGACKKSEFFKDDRVGRGGNRITRGEKSEW